jgi:hypothetical protein
MFFRLLRNMSGNGTKRTCSSSSAMSAFGGKADIGGGRFGFTCAPSALLQAYLGHKNIQHTVRYTELSPTRFKNFWRE